MFYAKYGKIMLKEAKNSKTSLKKTITTGIIGFVVAVLIGIGGYFFLSSEQQEQIAEEQGNGENLIAHEQICLAISTPVVPTLTETLPQLTLTTPSIGDIIPFGEYSWRVLDVQDDRALLLSEHIIERKAYHDHWDGTVTWETSMIRYYLNNQFLNSFGTEERARIVEARVVNNDNPWWFGMSGGNDTNDRIFLLSIEEVVKYFGDSGQLWNQNHPDNERWGISDQYNTERIALDIHGNVSWWWLRSPGFGNVFAAIVCSVGGLRIYGNFVVIGPGGVRPALWLEL